MTHAGFAADAGVLTCRGLSLEDVAAEFGTPLYVYDAEGIAERIRRFESAFGAVPFLLAYSVKANGALGLLNRIAGWGGGADIVSLGELHRALRAEVPASRIVFAGVGKTEEEMRAGLDAGIRAFHVESPDELELLARVAESQGKVAPVGIRVNPDVESPTPHAYTRTGHAASKFGIPAGEAEALVRDRSGDPRLRFRGLVTHIGSQIVESAPYVRALEVVLTVHDRLHDAGIEFEYIDLGGGFGVGYEGDAGMDIEALAAEVVPPLRDRGLELVLEPGRSIVAESGILLTRVQYVKRSGEKTFIIADGGMTELLRPSHYEGYHRITPVRERPEAPEVVADVVGPICETGDFLARDRPIPLPEAGDLLAVWTVGAYGFTMASNYNARRRPAEVMVEEGRALLLRRRESLDDLVRGEEIPPPPGFSASDEPTEGR